MNRVAQITSSRHFCFFLRLYHTLYQNLLDKNNDNLFPRLFPFSFKLHDSTKFIKIVHHEINPLSILFQNLLNESNFFPFSSSFKRCSQIHKNRIPRNFSLQRNPLSILFQNLLDKNNDSPPRLFPFFLSNIFHKIHKNHTL